MGLYNPDEKLDAMDRWGLPPRDRVLSQLSARLSKREQSRMLTSSRRGCCPPPMEGIGKPQHHYEFKQNGASIYRFDLDTGEACWMQLSQADAGTPMAHCVVKP